MELKDKIVLITGKWNKKATHALAWAMARKGAHIVLVNKASDAVDPITREIRDGGKKAVVIQADVRREPELARMTHQALAAFGRIDILIHHLGPVRSLMETSRRAATSAALTRQLRLQQAVMPTLLRQQSGTIINVGKVRGRSKSVESLGAIMTRVKGHCLQVQAIGPLAGNAADAEPALKRQFGEAMGLNEYPCLQVRHLPKATAGRAKPGDITGFLMGLICDGR